MIRPENRSRKFSLRLFLREDRRSVEAKDRELLQYFRLEHEIISSGKLQMKDLRKQICEAVLPLKDEMHDRLKRFHERA